MSERPFELTPDPRYLFLSSRHKEALAHLTYAVEERRGFVQLTGEIGTGKTMMLDALVMGLDASTKVARLSHTTISENELLDVLLAEFGIESQAERKLEKLRDLQSFLDEWTERGRNAVLVVDEAQNLSLPVLEEIRLLSNLRSHGKCSLQIVLAGQPEFRDKLDRSELRQLKQRIGIRYHLTPLSEEETAEYVAHRMEVAGADSGKVFDTQALNAVYRHTGGVPRMINILCDRALVAGYAANAGRIGASLIQETAVDVEGRPVDEASAEVRVLDARIDRPVEPRPSPQGRRRTTRAIPAWLAPLAFSAAVVLLIGFFGTKAGWWRADREPNTGAVSVTTESLQAFASEPREAAVPSGLAAAAVAETLGGGRALSPGTARQESREGSEAEAIGRATNGTGASPAQSVADRTRGTGATRAEAHAEDEVLEESAPPVETRPVAAEADPGQVSEAGETEGDPVGGEGTPWLRSGPGGPYIAIALSSRNEEATLEEAARLRATGPATEVIPVDLGEGDMWYRLVVGVGYPSIEQAEVAVGELRELGYSGAWVGRK